MKKKTIILVDDDKWLIDLYAEKFRQEDYNVYTAFNGKDGFDLVAKYQPDIVLSDVVMPGGDGFYLLKRIKDTTATSQIPVVNLTNLCSDQDRQALTELGATAYLVKADHTPTQVAEKISKLLGGKPENKIMTIKFPKNKKEPAKINI
jgi:DNA-binding response OmpR family regulator